MWGVRYSGVILMAACLAIGCGDPPPPSPVVPLPVALTSQPAAAQVQEPAVETVRLRAEIAVLEQDVDHLRKREELLAAETRRMKFLSEQQARQLEAVAEAIKQRDAHKRQIEDLTAEKEALLKLVQDLRRQLQEMQQKFASATRPAR